jgi:hypothetical protein
MFVIGSQRLLRSFSADSLALEARAARRWYEDAYGLI